MPQKREPPLSLNPVPKNRLPMTETPPDQRRREMCTGMAMTPGTRRRHLSKMTIKVYFFIF